jgi:hypothetical protein
MYRRIIVAKADSGEKVEPVGAGFLVKIFRLVDDQTDNTNCWENSDSVSIV